MRITLAVPLLLVATAAPADEEIVTVRPTDNGAALVNPGMGWVFHYYDNVPAHYGSKLAPSDTLDDWPGLSVIYLRIRGFSGPRRGMCYYPPDVGKILRVKQGNWRIE
jgi:hypothetical protein